MSIIATFVNAYPNRKLINYSYLEQWKDIMPALLMSVAMGAIVYVISFLNIATWLILVLQVVTGTVLYIGLAKVFKLESLNYLILTLKEIVKSRRAG